MLGSQNIMAGVALMAANSKSSFVKKTLQHSRRCHDRPSGSTASSFCSCTNSLIMRQFFSQSARMRSCSCSVTPRLDIRFNSANVQFVCCNDASNAAAPAFVILLRLNPIRHKEPGSAVAIDKHTWTHVIATDAKVR
jgi:hypothetical protein